MARGIPAFDFVWIDALLQSGALTPFQAKMLETSSPEQLRVGPCILLDRLGRGESSETYLATPANSTGTLALKRLRLPAETVDVAWENLQTLAERLRGFDHPSAIGPHAVDRGEGDRSEAEILLFSRHVDGPNCRELLIRRGRFPVEVVVEIARQLASALSALESRACLHGQIRLTNVRLTAAGLAVLVDAGVGGALNAGLCLRGDVSPETYDGTAPELIGTGSLRTAASDIYAFGCLLWHLLAGRAPFPTGDPLGKLAAHQSRAIPEIGDLAPDTPPPLAEAIRAMTERDFRKRPSSFAEVTARFGPADLGRSGLSGPRGRSRLARFIRQFNSAAPLETPTPTPERERRFPTAAAFGLALALSTAWILFDPGVTRTLHGLGVNVSSAVRSVFARPRSPAEVARDGRTTSNGSETGVQPLPAPDADGLVLLDAGPYEAATISCVGDLVLRGRAVAPSLIVVREQPLSVVCRNFTMDHVSLRRDAIPSAQPRVESGVARAASAPASLLQVRSQEVLLQRCDFIAEEARQTGSGLRSQENKAPTQPVAAVGWSAAGAGDPDAGRIRLSNCCFFNAGAAVVCSSPPGRLEVDNCLKIGGTLFDLRQRAAARDLAVFARHLTLRRAESLCRARLTKAESRKAPFRAVLEECVFDLAGPNAGLFQLVSGAAVRRDPPVLVTGSGSVLRPDVPIVCWTSSAVATRTPAELSNAVVEGLAVGDFQFIGPSSLAPGDSAVDGHSLQIPRRSEAPPGILAQSLMKSVPASLAN